MPAVLATWGHWLWRGSQAAENEQRIGFHAGRPDLIRWTFEPRRVLGIRRCLGFAVPAIFQWEWHSAAAGAWQTLRAGPVEGR